MPVRRDTSISTASDFLCSLFCSWTALEVSSKGKYTRAAERRERVLIIWQADVKKKLSQPFVVAYKTWLFHTVLVQAGVHVRGIPEGFGLHWFQAPCLQRKLHPARNSPVQIVMTIKHIHRPHARMVHVRNAHHANMTTCTKSRNKISPVI